MANTSKVTKRKDVIAKAQKNQLPQAVKKGTRIQQVRSPKGLVKKTGPNQGTTPSKKPLTKTPASKTKKKFPMGKYFDENAGPFGGFRGVTTIAKRP